MKFFGTGKNGAECFSVEKQTMQRNGEEHFTNMLVIGNGFDLAHGLPAKYGD